MKKSFFLFACTALLMAGCTKEAKEIIEPEKAEPQEVKTYTITALTEDPSTRSTATLNEDKTVTYSWEENEQISVVPVGQVATLPFTVVDPGQGTFRYSGTGTYDGFGLAVTPASALVDGASVGENTASFTIRFSGHYPVGHSNVIMVAGAPSTGTDNNPIFHFKHIAGLVKVTYKNVPAGTKKMVFSADGATICGDFAFNTISGITAEPENISGTTGTEAYVEFESATTAVQESVDFYLPIPIGTYSTFSVYLADNNGVKIDGTDKSWTASTPFQVTRCKVIRCPEIKVVSVVENFYSSTAGSDLYSCSKSLNTNDNRKDFDYTWSLSSGTGTVFTNGIKLGSGSSAGAVTSSNILNDFPDGSSFTVKVYAAGWGSDNGKLKVSYGGVNYEESPSTSISNANSAEYSASHFGEPKTFVFTKNASATDLTVASTSKRIIIDKIEIVSGGAAVPVETLIVTPDSNNPETVPSAGGVLYYTVTTSNISSWSVVSSNMTDFTPEKTANGFKVTVSTNNENTSRNATITVSGGNKTETVTISQAASEGSETPATDSFKIMQSSIPFNGSGYQSYSDVLIGGFTFEFTNVMKHSSDIQMKASSGAIFNSSAIGQRIVSISFATITNNVIVSAGAEKDNLTVVTGTDGTYTFADGVKFFKISTGSDYAVIGEITIKYISSGGGDQPEKPTQTVTFTPGTDTGGTSVTKDGIKVTMTTMNNSSYYQIYANRTMKVEGTARTIKGISFTCTTSDTHEYGPGNASASAGEYTYDGKIGTWAGSTREVTFTASQQIRMTSLTVTYVED